MKRIYKSIIIVFAAVLCFADFSVLSFARKTTAVMSVEMFSIGCGYLCEPAKIIADG